MRLRSADGTDLGEVADDRVEVRAGETDAGAHVFREVELELRAGAGEAHRAVVLARLRGAGAGAPDATPKIARALGRAAEAPPDVVVPDAGAHASVELVVQRAIASSVHRLVAHDPGVRIGEDVEAVHQARVATRRLRSDLRTFREVVDEQWAEGLRDELRWLGDVLGGVRDADVLIERLERELDTLPEVDRPGGEVLVDRLRADRERARERLLAALRSDRYDRVLDRLVEAARRPRLLLRVGDESDEALLTEMVRRPWRKIATAVAQLDVDPPDHELHEVRIRAKRARYAAEAVQVSLGKRARTFARALVGVQDALGEHQDAVIAGEWLRRSAAESADGAVGFAAGELASIERGRAAAAREQWRGAWAAVDRKRVRGWL